MSILSEILNSGHVEKDLLDALDDEQKQLLFCQMRAEQVRKWEANELKFENSKEKRPKSTKRPVRWLLGNDNNVWVWVMGEHPSDPSIDQILENEARHEAHIRAVRELSETADDKQELLRSQQEDALKAQLGNLRLGAAASNVDDGHVAGPQQAHYFQPTNNSGVLTATVSSYSTPAVQHAELTTDRRSRPALLPKPKLPAVDGNSENKGARTVSSISNDLAEMKRRETEIFQRIQQERHKLHEEAEAESERQRKEWEQQNERAREAEATMREMAQKARQLIRTRTSTSILPALADTKASSLREAIKNLPRPPKPKSRQAIVDWFKKVELPRGTGLDPKTKAAAPWFHGIISREQAEVLLQDKPAGAFLVRVSERIWGFTVSYVVGDGTFKHFLVEKISDGYQFLGTNQVVHDQLYDLVAYHESAPITAKGGEVLKWAVGQVFKPADYADLIQPPVLQGFSRY